MGATKKELFTNKQNEIATMAKAIAHPARVAILQQLVKHKECVCGGLVEELKLAQPTISQHLNELKTSGLITGTVEGVNVCYCINPKIWNRYQKIFADLFTPIELDDKCC